MPPKCPDSVAPNGNIQKTGASGYFSCVSQDPESSYTLCAANTSKDETRFDYQLEDMRIRDSALGHLELAAARLASPDKDVEGSKGFFIGCGFHKPHVPFVFPAEFLQHFPEDLDDIPLADDTYAPIGMPDAAWHYPADVHGFPIKFNGTCNETRSRNFRRGCAFDRCLRPPLPSFSSLSALSASNLSASDCDAVIVIVAWAHLSVCRFTRMS